MKIALYIIVAIVAIYGILSWSNRQDAKRIEAYQKYEECVQDEYGTTPAHWYAEHGELPPCQR